MPTTCLCLGGASHWSWRFLFVLEKIDAG